MKYLLSTFLSLVLFYGSAYSLSQDEYQNLIQSSPKFKEAVDQLNEAKQYVLTKGSPEMKAELTLSLKEWLKSGIDCNAAKHLRIVKKGRTESYIQAVLDKADFIKSLPELPKETKNTQLLLSYADSGNLAGVKRLIAKGIPYNTTGDDNYTAFTLALEGGHLELAKYLLSRGANVNDATFENVTMLMHATPFPELIQLLLSHGAKVNERSQDGSSALIFAVKDASLPSVKILLNHKAKINVWDEDHFSPLMHALCEGHYAIAEMLLEGGALFSKADYKLVNISLEKYNTTLKKGEKERDLRDFSRYWDLMDRMHE